MTRDEAVHLLAGFWGAVTPDAQAQVAITVLSVFIPGGEPALLALLSGDAVVVPKEPTDDMTVAGGEAQSRSIGSWGEPAVAYRAMLAATPYVEEKNDG